MKKIAVLILTLALLASVFAAAASPLQGSKNEKYYMITFLSGAAYWKGCYMGFQDAGKAFGVQTIYAGSPEYEINKAVTVFEQAVAQKPAGIAVACMNPDAFREPINRALKAGVKVLTFDTDSPKSDRMTFLCTDNFEAGGIAADALAKGIGGKGEVGMTVRPGQLNIDQRTGGFRAKIESAYSEIKIVATGNGGGDEQKAAQAVAAMIQAHPNLKGLFIANGIEALGAATAVKESGKDIKIVAFDADEAVLDLIKKDQIYAAIAQNTYGMGFWALNMLYMAKHNLCNPISDWKVRGSSPLPPYVNTGIDVAYKSNADYYYLPKGK